MSDATTTTLVMGRTIIRGVDRDGAAEVLDGGALVERGGLIVDIGTREELTRRNRIDRTLGSTNSILLPGLVNSHHHVGLTPLQLGSPDLPLEQWVIHRNGARDVDPHLDTLYSAFEMIESGITTVQHLQGRAPGPIDNIFSTACRVVDAYVALGMRVSYAFMLRDQNRVVHEADDAFLQRLPTPVATQMGEYLRAQSFEIDEYFWLIEALRDKYAGNGLVAIQLAPANLHWCSDKALERIAAFSDSHQMPFHIHLVETRYQQEYAKQRTGGTAVAHLDNLGLLGPRCTLGHAIWVNEADVELIAERGVHICHNCSSNMRLRSGRAPLNDFRRLGVNVALGIDEAGINDDRDMLQEMRMVLRNHRIPGMRPADVPSPGEVLRMATAGGAATTSFKEKIGRLEIGLSADLFLLDYDRLTAPYLDEETSLIDAVIQRAKSVMVSTVMVAGKVVYDETKFTLVDRGAVLAELAEMLNQPRTAAEIARRKLARELMPYVTQFYADYPIP